MKNEVERAIAEIELVVTDARETAVAVEEAFPDDEVNGSCRRFLTLQMIEQVQAGLLKTLATQDLLECKIKAIETVVRRLSASEAEVSDTSINR